MVSLTSAWTLFGKKRECGSRGEGCAGPAANLPTTFVVPSWLDVKGLDLISPEVPSGPIFYDILCWF